MFLLVLFPSNNANNLAADGSRVSNDPVMHKTAHDPKPCAFALASVGKSREARIAMMAITTNNSIRVNPSSKRIPTEFRITPYTKCRSTTHYLISGLIGRVRGT